MLITNLSARLACGRCPQNNDFLMKNITFFTKSTYFFIKNNAFFTKNNEKHHFFSELGEMSNFTNADGQRSSQPMILNDT